MWMCCDLLILPVFIESESLLRESLNLRQKHAALANSPVLSELVIIREHVFSTSMAVRQVFIATCRVHILLKVRHGQNSAKIR